MNSLFQCPVCQKALSKGEKQYFCPVGHCFDIARKGYVNFLLPKHKGSGDPGDNKEMIINRRAFLNKNYYEHFSDSLNNIVIEKTKAVLNSEQTNILDAGCGEGYYTSRLKKSLLMTNKLKDLNIYGIDVSKPAIHYAASRDESLNLAVASTYHLPVQSGSMDCVLCIFSPRDEQEFKRVLKPSGELIVAAPGPKHLLSLKAELYDHTEFIGQKGTVGEGFTLHHTENISYIINLQGTEDILSLIMMTPYIRHIEEAALNRLKSLTGLKTEVNINIMVYCRC